MSTKSDGAGFKSRVGTVANDLDAMANVRFNRQSVSMTKYNTGSAELMT